MSLNISRRDSCEESSLAMRICQVRLEIQTPQHTHKNGIDFLANPGLSTACAIGSKSVHQRDALESACAALTKRFNKFRAMIPMMTKKMQNSVDAFETSAFESRPPQWGDLAILDSTSKSATFKLWNI